MNLKENSSVQGSEDRTPVFRSSEDRTPVFRSSELSHIDSEGKLKMVNVSKKEVSERTAKAFGRIYMKGKTLSAVFDGSIPKGDVVCISKTAGILGAKRVHELIPLCHNILLDFIDIEIKASEDGSGIDIISQTISQGKTGAEMEALTAVSVCALTIYDMCKAIDREMEIGEIKLLEKSGGKSGPYKRGTSEP